MSIRILKTKSEVQTGFTLIELLVVIAIIAILAAILFPVFAKVREKARQVTCTSNERQIGLAMLQYVQDYDEKYPAGDYNFSAPFSTHPTLYGLGWAGQISSYVKSVGLFKCPDDTIKPGSNAGQTFYPVSYGMNMYIGNQSNATVAAPSTTVLVSEVGTVLIYIEFPDEGISEGVSANSLSAITDGAAPNNCGNGCGGFNNGPGWDIFSGMNLTGAPPVVGGVAGSGAVDATAGGYARHNPSTSTFGGSSNYLMSDGHVKFMPFASVSNGFTPGVCTAASSTNMGSYAATFCTQ